MYSALWDIIAICGKTLCYLPRFAYLPPLEPPELPPERPLEPLLPLDVLILVLVTVFPIK